MGKRTVKKRKEGRIEEHADVDRQWDRQTGELNRQKETEREGYRKRSKLARYNDRQKGRAEKRMAK